MMDDDIFERHLSTWLADGRNAASSWVVPSVIDHAQRNPRGVPFRVRWSEAMRAVAAVHPGSAGNRWAMVVIAALLVVALAGIGYIGARGLLVAPPSPTPVPSHSPTPSSVAFVCPPGTDPNTLGPVDQTRPWTGDGSFYDAGPFTFDSARGVALIGLSGSPSSLWQFDVCTNTWARSSIALKSAQAPQILVYDLATDQLLADEGPTDAGAQAVHSDTRLVSYDLGTGTRTVNATLPFDSQRVHAVFRPSAGQLVVRDDGASLLWSYDVSSDTWAELGQAGDVPPAEGTARLLAYDPTVDRLVLYSRNGSDVPPGPWEPRTYEYDFGTSTWTREADPLFVGSAYGGIAGGVTYDGALGRVMVFSGYGGITYDAAKHQWEALQLSPWLSDAPSYSDELAYDSTNKRIVVFDLAGSAVRAIDAVNGTWQMLLATPPWTGRLRAWPDDDTARGQTEGAVQCFVSG